MASATFLLFAAFLGLVQPLYGFVPPSGALRSHLQLHATTTASGFDLKGYMAERLPQVEKALDASVQSADANTDHIVEAMKYSLLAGGKRVRPMLVFAAAELFGASVEKAMPAAVAVEMIHTMSLIHDDLPSMDDDDLRRGKPTNHVVYGEDTAILAGDALLSEAFRHPAAELPKLGVPAEAALEVIVRLGDAVGAFGLVGGQIKDLECEGRSDVDLDDLRWIHTYKTAVLLKASVTAGAIVAGASPEDVKNMEVYADSIGLAFQVADDILDVTATSEELGKTAGKDQDQDKATYPKLMGLDGARAEAKRLMDQAIDSLSSYGEEAEPLRAIARYIVERKN
mmetsp:Transcript_12732/g.47015  ORF Transcript_12732/g.47015 Transcript_12732/m.47015 type:complete len:341 (-) Transcript_12732:137-1159(-)